MKKFILSIAGIGLFALLTWCFTWSPIPTKTTETTVNTESTATQNEDSSTAISTNSDNHSSSPIYSASDLFTSRDLEQEVDLEDAIYYTVEDGKNISISKEGTYVIQWSAQEVTISVEVWEEEKVQLVLDWVSISNTSSPCIYVKQADKVFITTTNSENTLEVTWEFVDDGEVNTNWVIFSKEDLTLNWVWSLNINSTKNGIVSKDDLKITWGSYTITASKKAIDANDSIRIKDWEFILNAGTDGLHAENNDDDSLGYIYIAWGNFTINAWDDAIHWVSYVQIDDWEFVINWAEGIEGSYIQINWGNITITATDDWINAAHKSESIETAFEINWGYVKITMWEGDTDWVDSNGNLYIYWWTLDITARSPTDYDWSVIYSWWSLIVDWEEYDYVPNQMMWGRGGNMGDMRGWRAWFMH